MTYVRTLALDPAADPIHAAIERHRVACDAHRAGPTLFTSDDLDAAFDTLVATPCATRFGALALLAHLRPWLLEEAEFAAGHQPSYRLAQARVADLTLFLGTNLPPAAIPQAFPSGRIAAAPADRLPPHQTRPLHLCVIRGFGAASELISAIAIIGAGAWLVGFATTL